MVGAIYAGLWWLLTDGDQSSWVVGAPAVALATVASVHLAGGSPFQILRVIGLGRFARFFVWESLRGGVDVARRAFHPDVPLAPGLLEHEIRLPPGPSRGLFAVTVSLLPGTLAADLNGRRLTLHVLDRDADMLRELRQLETYIAALFGLSQSESEAVNGERIGG